MATRFAKKLFLIPIVVGIAFMSILLISIFSKFSSSRQAQLLNRFTPRSENQGKIEVIILSLRLAKVADSDERILCIPIRVSNKTSQTLDYDSWNSSAFGFGATLRNSDGGEYTRVQFGASTSLAAAGPTSIPPNGHLMDELFFEYPKVGTAPTELTLRSKLPRLSITIPVSIPQIETDAASTSLRIPPKSQGVETDR